jgi:hemolysin III
VTFQSRLGRAKWLEPYTEPTLIALAKAGVGRVDVVCPGFTSDCLETLEEIAMEGRQAFLTAGGKAFNYIPCLNDDDAWITALCDVTLQHLAGWPTQAAPDVAALAASRAAALALGAKPRRTRARRCNGEKLNAITHLVGAVLALVGSTVLVTLAALSGDAWKVVSVTLYGVTLVLLYSFSTLYHSLRGKAKSVLQRLDHHSIYLLIAGSYTPFCLITLRGPWGWSLFGVVWTLALLGIAQELRPSRGTRKLSLAIYIVMGWVALVALVPMLKALGGVGFAWVAAGGIFYTVGIVFYVLDNRLRHAHGVTVVWRQRGALFDCALRVVNAQVAFDPRCAQAVVRCSMALNNSYMAMAMAPITARPAKASGMRCEDPADCIR